MEKRLPAESALRDSEHLTRLILDNAYDAFVAMDLDGHIVDWNRQAERLFGWSRDEALGRALVSTIVPERYRSAHLEGLERFRRTGEGAVLGRRIELEGMRRDGSVFPVEITISPAEIDGTKVFHAFIRDATESKLAERALRVANEEAGRARKAAERANNAKSEFLSRMSHELRTPLSAILGFGQLLETDDLKAEQREYVDHILLAGRHLLQIIDEVLDIARIEQGAMTISMEPVRVMDVIGASVDLVRPAAANAGVAISVGDVPGDAFVHADNQRLKQVLLNFLSNAVKYNREGGSVSVSCSRVEADRLRLSVADSGPGIHEEDMSRLFVPFERLGAEQGSVPGTGIGLSISKRLIELMGGTIGADSAPGQGATFWLELAETVAPGDAFSATTSGALPNQPVDARACTVLYVEDNLANLRLVEAVLSRRPQTTLIPAMQGGLALDLAREHRPDLVLLDVHLPDIDGDEVLRRLREDPVTRDIPVVVLSAEANPPKIKRFLDAGALTYLTKPLDAAQLLDLIEEVTAPHANPGSESGPLVS
jgi:PAS domain S-box-containing protein